MGSWYSKMPTEFNSWCYVICNLEVEDLTRVRVFDAIALCRRVVAGRRRSWKANQSEHGREN